MSGPNDNLVLPFHLNTGVFRGRLVRAGRAVTDTLAPHAYPPVVAALLAEHVSIGIALAAGLKYDGVFTLQARGNGPVHTLVVDVTSAGMVRGVARFDESRLPRDVSDTPVPALLGEGHMAFTVDAGPNTDRYQGIVALAGANLSDCVNHYFSLSEQLPTVLKTAVAAPEPGEPDASWRTTALMLQRMPPEAGGQHGEDWDEAWRTATILMDSLTDSEMLDPDLTPENLLRRPFHGEGLAVAPYQPVFFGCRCSYEKVARTLSSFPKEELLALEHEGSIDVTCEFCKATYSLTVQDLDAQTPPDSPSEGA